MSASFTAKKLISRVLPGVWLTRARELCRTNALSSDDLPTLDLPLNAISGSDDSGRQPPGDACPPRKARLRMTSGSELGFSVRDIGHRDAGVDVSLGAQREGEHLVHRGHRMEHEAFADVGCDLVELARVGRRNDDVCHAG